MISVEEALEQILSAIAPLGPERVALPDCLGRVLLEDIRAGRDIPPRDNSAMDGFAVRSCDLWSATAEIPVVLEIIEDVPAGTVPKKPLTAGKAARIMTGAPLPEGADAVVRREDTRTEGTNVAVFVEAEAGRDIRRAGEDVRRGDLVLPRGTVLRPAEVGMLASLGRSFVAVHQKPRVAIVSTGDELVEIDEPGEPWRIVNSNAYALAAQVAEAGAVPAQIGIARDRREDLEAAFRVAMRSDMVLSSGGVSVGDYDFVKDVMHEVGNRMQFWRVAMRPGRPLAFGFLSGVPLFGLPGNPVSSMVTFEQFVRPALLKMLGRRRIFRRAIKAVMADGFRKQPGFRHFVRAHVRREGGRYIASTTGDQGSGILRSMVLANGLVVLPADTEAVGPGDEVTVQLLDEAVLLTAEPEYL